MKFIRSIRFAKKRAEKTRDAQVALSGPPPGGPGWVFDKKTVLQWKTDCTLLDQYLIGEIGLRTDWRNAAALWQADVELVKDITQSVVALGRVHFAADAVKRKRFATLRTDAQSRDGVWEQGHKALKAWQTADATWVPDDGSGTTSDVFGSLLAACAARKDSHGTAYEAWRTSSTRLMSKARTVDVDNVAWYEVATRRFKKGTIEGDMIRSVVPTTTSLEKAVGKAAIANVMVVNGAVHFDFSALHATHFTVLQQSPGSPAFLIVLAETEERSFTAHGLPPGTYRFKVFGSNSRGEGAESAVIEITIAAEVAA